MTNVGNVFWSAVHDEPVKLTLIGNETDSGGCGCGDKAEAKPATSAPSAASSASSCCSPAPAATPPATVVAATGSGES